VINDNTRYGPKNSRFYKPGHKARYLQWKVMINKERFPLTVELVSPCSLRITTRAQTYVIYYQDTVALQLKCLVIINRDIQYCTESNLLHLKTKGLTATPGNLLFLPA
jgi:hypothetical protein